MDKPTVDELMDDILAVVCYPNRREGEYTAKELYDNAGMDTSYESFRGILDSNVTKGKLTKRWAMVLGQKKIVYKKAK